MCVRDVNTPLHVDGVRVEDCDSRFSRGRRQNDYASSLLQLVSGGEFSQRFLLQDVRGPCRWRIPALTAAAGCPLPVAWTDEPERDEQPSEIIPVQKAIVPAVLRRHRDELLLDLIEYVTGR